MFVRYTQIKNRIQLDFIVIFGVMPDKDLDNFPVLNLQRRLVITVKNSVKRDQKK